MENQSSLTWKSFKEQLQANQNLELQFQYAANTFVKPSYHITEIKQAPITSVDCGGKKNEWTEVIVQLWEPEEKQQEAAMKVSKALSIINIVENVLPLDPSAIVKIEFGNALFDTRHLLPKEIRLEGQNLIVDLRPDTVQCKAIGRGDSCGSPASGEECCTPARSEKPKIQLKNLVAESSCCTPGSGCC